MALFVGIDKIERWNHCNGEWHIVAQYDNWDDVLNVNAYGGWRCECIGRSIRGSDTLQFIVNNTEEQLLPIACQFSGQIRYLNDAEAADSNHTYDRLSFRMRK